VSLHEVIAKRYIWPLSCRFKQVKNQYFRLRFNCCLNNDVCINTSTQIQLMDNLVIDLNSDLITNLQYPRRQLGAAQLNLVRKLNGRLRRFLINGKKQGQDGDKRER